MEPLQLTFGSDPELVIVDKLGNPCSAIRILKTNKDHPIDLGDSVRMYADNALVEAAFDPVAPDQIVDRLGEVLQKMNKALKGFFVMPQAATMFSKEELEAVLLDKEGHPKLTAWEIGCHANFDAYRVAANEMAKFKDGMRTGSFHIHIGRKDWKTAKDDRLMDLDSKVEAIKLLDLYVGVASVIFDKDPTAHLRRKLYGRAGEFRPTDYGVEYRVLGNYALRARRLTELVFDLVEMAMYHVSVGNGRDMLELVPEKEIIRIINDNDRASAIDVVDTLKVSNAWKKRIMSHEDYPANNLKPGWGF